jgi:hypothetical protein
MTAEECQSRLHAAARSTGERAITTVVGVQCVDDDDTPITSAAKERCNELVRQLVMEKNAAKGRLQPSYPNIGEDRSPKRLRSLTRPGQAQLHQPSSIQKDDVGGQQGARRPDVHTVLRPEIE